MSIVRFNQQRPCYALCGSTDEAKLRRDVHGHPNQSFRIVFTPPRPCPLTFARGASPSSTGNPLHRRDGPKPSSTAMRQAPLRLCIHLPRAFHHPFLARTRNAKATTHAPCVRAWFFLGERRNSPNRMTRRSTCRREIRRTSWRRASPKHATMSRAFGRCAVVRAARFGVSPMRSAVEVIRHAPLPVERKWEGAATRRMGSGVTEVFSGKGFGELLAMRNSKAKE